MSVLSKNQEKGYLFGLKWLIFFRILFASLLLGSTIVLHVGESHVTWDLPIVILYGLISCLFLLSAVYLVLLRFTRQVIWLAYIQIAVDTVAVTLVIFLTGSFQSLFSFLYLVVIIYASMLLFRRGSMIMAALCSIQYGILVDLEYYGIVIPFGMEDALPLSLQPWSYVLYKVVIIMVACFAVAFLSGFLAEQNRATRKELQAMETHVKRVEKMAAVGEMAAGLAHEIKNPLASLRGSIQLLKDEIRCGPAHEKLMQIILREADRLNNLVSNFLLFAKPPAGKIETIDLGKTLMDTVEIFIKNNKFSRNIQIVKEIETGIWIEVDPGHLRQVFWNLLLNAAESIQSQGRVDVSLHSAKDHQAVVGIRDTGCGIPKEMLPSIFDPFVTTKPNGTGLGLSIVHRIVEAYDSRIDVESTVNVGTVFYIWFKRVPSPPIIPSVAAL